MVSYPSTTAHYLDILIPTVAQYHQSDPPELVFTSYFPRLCRYIAVARHSTCGEKKLGNPWHLTESCNTAMRNGILRAMDVLIGQICMEDGYRIR